MGTTTVNLGRALTERRGSRQCTYAGTSGTCSRQRALLLLTSSELQLCLPLHPTPRLTLGCSILVRPEEQISCGEHPNEVDRGEGCQTRHMMPKAHTGALRWGSQQWPVFQGRWSRSYFPSEQVWGLFSGTQALTILAFLPTPQALD